MPVSLVALKKLTYAGRPYTAGEIFEARDLSDAMVLKMTKLAKDAPTSAPVPAATPLEPEPEPSEDINVIPQASSPASEDETPVRRRRTYRRRDLTAEEP